MIAIELLHNLALLVTISIVSGLVKFNRTRKNREAIIQGILFGSASVIGMLNPVVLEQGLFFDGRSILISLSALFFGPVTGTISAIFAITCRIFQGGIGMLTGIFVILSSALTGIFFHYFWVKRKTELTSIKIVFFSELVHIFMLVIMLTLPYQNAKNVFNTIGMPVLIMYPLVSLLISKTLRVIVNNRQLVEELKRSENLLKKSQKIANLGSWELDIDSKSLFWSDEIYRIFGFQEQEFAPTYAKFLDSVHPEDREAIDSTYSKSVIDGNIGFEFIHRIIKNDTKEIRYIHERCEHVRNLNGKIIRSVGMAQDITERKLAEDTLRKNEERLALINNSSQDIIYSYDTNGRFTSANKKFCEIMNMKLDRIIGHTHRELGFPEAQCKEWDSLHQQVYSTNRTIISETTTPLPDGNSYFYEVILNPLHDDEGQIIGIGGTTRDITERKQSAKKIIQLSRAVEQSSVSIIITDLLGNIEYVNPKVTEVTGFTSDELIGNNWQIFGPMELNAHLHDDLWESISVGNEWRGVFHNQKKNGEFFWESALISPIKDEDGNFSHFLSVKEDITEAKKSEELLKSSLKEKETLLRELYHRTKNNMQVISAFLSLKSATLKDEKAVAILGEMGNRIKSMALVHQKLYQSQDLSYVKLDEYLRELTALIISNYQIAPDKIKINFDLQMVDVLIDYAIPCGLIVNELISNSFKYAFPGSRKGEVSISLKRRSDNSIELQVSDNGVGIPVDTKLDELNTLGYQLINSISIDQLLGEVNFETNNGVRFELVFKDDSYSPRV